VRDADRLRKEASRLQVAAQDAAGGRVERAKRLEVRAEQCLADAAVLDAVEARLRREQAKVHRNVLHFMQKHARR
jgi:hypothetical protein